MIKRIENLIYIRNVIGGSQRGFTLIEALMATALSTLILISLYTAVMEGSDISRDIAMTQDADRSLNNSLIRFSEDMRGARYFYNGTESDGDGGTRLNETPNPREVIFSIMRTDGTQAWVKYELYFGSLTGDTYLVRLSDYETPGDARLSYISHDVAAINFNYFNEDGFLTDDLTEVAAIEMALTIDTGVVAKEQDVFVSLRNENQGLDIPDIDFESARDSQIIK